MSPSGQGAIRIGLSPWGGGPRLFTRTGEAVSHRGSLGISVVDVVLCFSYAPFTLLSALLTFPEVQAAPGQPNTPLSPNLNIALWLRPYVLHDLLVSFLRCCLSLFSPLLFGSPATLVYRCRLFSFFRVFNQSINHSLSSVTRYYKPSITIDISHAFQIRT